MPVVLLLAKVPEMASEDLYTFYVPSAAAQAIESCAHRRTPYLGPWVNQSGQGLKSCKVRGVAIHESLQ